MKLGALLETRFFCSHQYMVVQDFHSSWGAPEVEATPELRMDCTFVDFREGNWKFGALFAKEHLDTFLGDVEARTASIRARI
jgi:hypothetical protein